jgi:reverse gyrase
MIRDELEKTIRKLPYPLKDEDEIITILKRRLTKKEYKVLTFKASNMDLEEMTKELKVDMDRLTKIDLTLVKKINQEKIKHDIMVIS